MRGYRSVFSNSLVLIALIAPHAVNAQSVGFETNLPSSRLHAPEFGKLGQEIKNQLWYDSTLQPSGLPPVPATPVIDPRKSLFITDENIMRKISFSDVMDQLANQGGDPKTDKRALFKQWWDSQAEAPGTATGPHCKTVMNGFPYDCPRQEAGEAKIDPFSDPAGNEAYSAIAYINRPDLADPPFDCGEARIVFAKNWAKNPIFSDDHKRNLIIFEARLLNPKPRLGLFGCFEIQKFWQELSGVDVDQNTRGDRLRQFFLNGLPEKNIMPVVHIDNYTTGQIRTNQFMNRKGEQGVSFSWTLREFKIQKLEPGLRIVPVTVKSSPDPSLFSGTAPVDLQARFIKRLSDQFDNLRGNGNEGSPSAVTLDLSQPEDDAFNPFEGNEEDSTRGSIAKVFDKASLVGAFVIAKLDELKRLGLPRTSLTAIDIAIRVETQTCAGCHLWSNNQPLGGGAGKWPSSIDRSHVSELPRDQDDSPEGGKRFGISQTVKSNGFIPLRCAVMSRILNVDSTPCNYRP